MNACRALGCGKPSGAYALCRLHYFMLPLRLRYQLRHHLDEAIEYLRKLESEPPQILYSCTLGGPEE
jgi:hypothetical protein